VTRPLLARAATALLLGLALLTACAPAPAPPAPTAAPKAAATVKIGVIEMLTGGSALYGNAVLTGLKTATSVINAKGGVLGKTIELDVRDNASDDAQTTTLMKQLGQDSSIGAVIPPTYQANFLVACAAANSLHVPVVSAQSGPPDTKSNPDDWCHTMTTDPSTQISSTFNYLHDKYGYSKFDMVYDQTNGYVSFQRPNIEAAAKAGGYQLNEVGVGAGQSDFSPQITKVIEDKPDATFPFMTIEDGARFMQQAKAKGYTAGFFDPVSSLPSSRLVSLSAGAAEGLISSTPQSAGDMSSFQAFLDAYQKETGAAPDDPTYAGFGYDALSAIAAAMTAAGSTSDRAAIQAAITKLDKPCFSICYSSEKGGAFLAAKYYFVKLTTQGFAPNV
jgi:branched-chain amino acid transport system substrate-binding protein